MPPLAPFQGESGSGIWIDTGWRLKKQRSNALARVQGEASDYNLAVNTHFWARSKFNSIVNFDPLMANNGLLKSWDQTDFVMGLLSGGRHNYKNKLLAQGKQTVVKPTTYAT